MDSLECDFWTDKSRGPGCRAAHSYRLLRFAVLCRALQLAGKLGWSDHPFVGALDLNLGATMNELFDRVPRVAFASRTRAPRMVRLLLLLFVYALAGCGGNGNAPISTYLPPPQSPPAPSAPQDARQGRYVGTVNVAGIDYFGDALLTADGLIRLYIGGPYVSDGTIQHSIPAGSAQLVGTTANNTSDPDGNDLIFGQGQECPANALWTCGVSHANPSLAVQSGNLQGEIVVLLPEFPETSETWTLDL